MGIILSPTNQVPFNVYLPHVSSLTMVRATMRSAEILLTIVVILLPRKLLVDLWLLVLRLAPFPPGKIVPSTCARVFIEDRGLAGNVKALTALVK